jgi:hypothetical protein
MVDLNLDESFTIVGGGTAMPLDFEMDGFIFGIRPRQPEGHGTDYTKHHQTSGEKSHPKSVVDRQIINLLMDHFAFTQITTALTANPPATQKPIFISQPKRAM